LAKVLFLKLKWIPTLFLELLRLGLAFTQQRICQVEERIGSSFKAGVDLLTNLLQSVKVHWVSGLCFLVLLAKHFTSSGSFWQSKAAFWFPLVYTSIISNDAEFSDINPINVFYGIDNLKE
jgi:hypothetical protein